MITKFVWSGAAVLFAFVMALGLVAERASADAPAVVTVLLSTGEVVAPGAEADQAVGGTARAVDDTDSIQADQNNARVVQVVVDVDDAEAGALANNSDETIVTLTTPVGTWSNGNTTMQVQCAKVVAATTVAGVTIDNNDAADVDVPADDDADATYTAVEVGITEGAFTGLADGAATSGATGEVDDTHAAVAGCWGVSETLIIPAGVAPGTYQISAQTTNGVAGVNTLVVTAPTAATATGIAVVSEAHNAIGFDATNYDVWVNGSVVTFRVTGSGDAGVNARQVTFSTNAGVLRQADVAACGAIAAPETLPACSEAEVHAACQSAMVTGYGTTVIDASGVLGTTSTNQGRAQVILCGTSGAAGSSATVTATVTGTSLSANSDPITISAKPDSADIDTTVSGNTITVRVMVDGVPGPDDTAVVFTPLPSDNAAVAPGCVLLHDGVASTAFAVSGGTSGSVLVSLQETVDGECGSAVQETYGTDSAQLFGGTTPPPPPGGTCPEGTIISGSIPPGGGFGLIVYCGGTIQQLVTATGCPVASMALWHTVGGNFITYVPGTTITAVNADFMAYFQGGVIPPNTPFIGKCR